METLQVGIRSSSLRCLVYHQVRSITRGGIKSIFSCKNLFCQDSLDDGSELSFQGHVIKGYKIYAECPHFVDRWHRSNICIQFWGKHYLQHCRTIMPCILPWAKTRPAEPANLSDVLPNLYDLSRFHSIAALWFWAASKTRLRSWSNQDEYMSKESRWKNSWHTCDERRHVKGICFDTSKESYLSYPLSAIDF